MASNLCHSASARCQGGDRFESQSNNESILKSLSAIGMLDLQHRQLKKREYLAPKT